jgi:hypothetical protein
LDSAWNARSWRYNIIQFTLKKKVHRSFCLDLFGFSGQMRNKIDGKTPNAEIATVLGEILCELSL